MKKIFVVLAVALLAPIAVVRAETVDGTTASPVTAKPAVVKLEERVKKVEQKAEDKKAKIADKLEAKQDKIDGKASTTKERIEKKIEVKKEANKVKALELAKRAERKITAAIQRIELLANRVTDRLNILADKGVVKADTKKEVEAKLAEAKTLIADAKDSASKISVSADAAIASSSPKEALKDTKEAAKKAEDAVKEAHAKVVEAVTLIKASGEKNAENATTTPNK
ncbi:MAG TPA: hypothetical protein P5056_01550 [Candidatus Paceibacterota bacterium]|nr:hypothetical protein [Candidatus Paceibacterota bacterium]